MIKRSVQRELIRNNLAHRTDHPTADMVYQSIREELPNISLGTVYRNLRFLVDQGDALSLKLGDGKEHFDGNVNPHFHFICTQCGCVDDIFMPSIDEICTTAAQYYSGDIKGHSTYFYGTCPKCKTKH
ncbi:transcriptional repressor [uncultured Eubacterium sp.]|uniref:Fur family transcriptional regulator n=1 Tax=uncultured Eubacterium sp. TaxID=165185 RepID=UPI00259AD9CE|nr:transcriptional repressor [uncultured Eubacterium sp.]